MTVKQLIKQLEKMPQNLQVYVSDHDHSEYETNGEVGDVTLIDRSNAGDIRKYGYVSYSGIIDKDGYISKHDQERFDSTPEKYVTLHL